MYTGYSSIRRDGKDHFAEIVVQASPSQAPSLVTLSAKALDDLMAVFGEDFDYHRHNVWAAIAAQIGTANVAGHMPHVGAMSFHAEVLSVRVSGNVGREVSGALLTMAGMDAIGKYLVAVEQFEETERGK
jgi:hypothetical protein